MRNDTHDRQKTYCFLYRKAGSADVKTHYVEACGWVQASSIARRELGLSGCIVWYCVPSRRGLIKQYMDILSGSYSGGCNS